MTALTMSLLASVTVPLSVGAVPAGISRSLRANAAPAPWSVWLASIARLPVVVPLPVWT